MSCDSCALTLPRRYHCYVYAAIFELESWLYLDGLNGIETAAVLYGSAPRYAPLCCALGTCACLCSRVCCWLKASTCRCHQERSARLGPSFATSAVWRLTPGLRAAPPQFTNPGCPGFEAEPGVFDTTRCAVDSQYLDSFQDFITCAAYCFIFLL